MVLDLAATALDFFNSNEGFFSLVLSAGLLWVYRNQNRILRAQRRSDVQIVDREYRGDSLKLQLANYGRGAASNLSIQTIPRAKFERSSEDEPEDPEAVPWPAERPIRKVDSDGEQTREQSLLPQTRNVEFTCEPPLGLKRGEDITKYANFSSGTRNFARAGISEFDFKLVIKYQDELGKEESRAIQSAPTSTAGVDLSEGPTLQECYTGIVSGELIENPTTTTGSVRKFLQWVSN